jgi:serine phosphatase RsbU (regulator of sigma subunit)
MTATLPPGMPPPPLWAAELQRMLVPSIDFSGAGVEAYGESVPKDDVGGDLIDLVPAETGPVAYVADVSGHGLRAGFLMGTLKMAIRYGLLLRQPMAKLLEDINRILPSVKAANMFATFAALRISEPGNAEYISAGHVPLLHYRRSTRAVVRYAMSQFPLGIFDRGGYMSCRIRYEPGDILALVTDGVVEIGRHCDAELGLERLVQTIRAFARRPLPEMAAAIYAGISREGPQHDDATILLIRAEPVDGARRLAEDCPNHAESAETAWRDLLDELAAELSADAEN